MDIFKDFAAAYYQLFWTRISIYVRIYAVVIFSTNVLIKLEFKSNFDCSH